ncbi:hypothetical protein [Archaeoglobus neptunius]|uniref:hypothetical protein n=1 Tax=Archaeoglobus neptunius TaxID=2798580 RepID=UPI001927F21C|nr:hypothetical protein [Archaeoglobus neptunius]
MVPPFFNFFSLGIAALSFFLISIILPGFFIWIGLRVLGKDRGIVRCGFANFAAFTITAVVAMLLHFTPLFIIVPFLAFLIYLYVLKSLLDISFIEAFAATVIASVVVFLTAVIMLAMFGVWLLLTPPPPPMVGMRF